MSSLPPTITYTTAQPHHAQSISELIGLAFEIPPEDCTEEGLVASPASVARLIERFPTGQFIALDGAVVVSAALTLLVSKSPYEPPKKWMEVLGDLSAKNHNPQGEWLYGFEFMVHPAYRKYGIGTRMYAERFAFIQRHNLRGFYAGGVLMGWKRYADQMTPYEYGLKVVAGELEDPTVTMQLRRGLKAQGVIERYLIDEDNPDWNNTAVLIAWENPTYRPLDL
jgi:GNAT superfamily N-acetyltransferase